ncbi:hypothetical protein PybrP1_012209 [[Pythium] brassicae (nom. inval.)]|nr:hypothetical protein PybrP1_012209 [[Pythium] brassicae (nom. inval.)]
MSVPAAADEAAPTFGPTGSSFTDVLKKACEWSVIFKGEIRVQHSIRDSPKWLERSTDIRKPFKRWSEYTFVNFDLSTADVYGAACDVSGGVLWMLAKGLVLQLEWCLANLTNAATQRAFGIEPRQSSRNPDMTDHTANVLALEGKNRKTNLLGYQAHRFLGLARVAKPVIEKKAQHTSAILRAAPPRCCSERDVAGRDPPRRSRPLCSSTTCGWSPSTAKSRSRAVAQQPRTSRISQLPISTR